MVWVITNSGDSTADHLCERLKKEGVSFLRLDTDHLTELATLELDSRHIRLEMAGKSYSPQEASHVWLRRPKPLEVPSMGDEAEIEHVQAEWSEAIEGILELIPRRKWINHPASNVGASHKVEQLIRAKKIGLNTPASIITNNREAIRKFWQSQNEAAIVKPLASGYLERKDGQPDTVIYTNVVTEEQIQEAESICPSLVQQRVDKQSDVRVTVLDDSVFAVELLADEIGRQRLDIRRNNMRDVKYRAISLPTSIQDALLKLLRSYHLRFAAVDFVVDHSGAWFFLEINPNGQWAWLDLTGVTDIAGAFSNLFRCR